MSVLSDALSNILVGDIPSDRQWNELWRRNVIPEDVKKKVTKLAEEASRSDVRAPESRPEMICAPSQEGLVASDSERKFQLLLARWKEDTTPISNEVTILLHPAHLAIVGMGREALPYIFKDLETGGGPWFVALQAITLENPITPESAKSSSRMREDWLNWGRKNDYVGAR